MKNLALIMMFSVAGVALNAEEYTIQTISAQKEGSITPAFEKKVKKSTLSSDKKKEGDCNIVTVGKYTSSKAARHDLKKAKAISKDAFVRPVNRTTPKVCETKVAVADGKKSAVEPKNEKSSPAHTPIVAEVAKKEPAAHEAVVNQPVNPSAAHAATVQHSAIATATKEVKAESKSEPCKVQPCENIVDNVYVYDKNLVRKSDIHEAIEYYKNSPYHTFKPVLTQR
jgi:hypothetical protein